MDILIARDELTTKPKKITLNNLKKEIQDGENEIYYFDRDNSHKNMLALVESLEADNYNVYLKEVKYGLADDEYMYEMHII